MDLISELAKQGLLALLLAISLLANYKLATMLFREKDKRIDDAVKSRDSLAAPIGEMKDSLGFIERKIRVAKGE